MQKPNEYIIELFHKLREDISWIKNRLFTEQAEEQATETSPEYTIDAVHKRDKPDDKERSSIRATLNLPEAIRIEAKTEERQKKWYRDRAILLQIAGICIGVVVAGIYFLQLRDMDKTVELSRKVAERESRALVSIKPNGEIQIVKDQSLQLSVRLTNLGNSTARNIVSRVYVGILPRLQAPTVDFGTPTPMVQYFVADMFPKDVQDFPAARQKAIGPPREGGRDTEPRPLSESEFNELTAGNTYVVAIGIVKYEDVYHIQHWSTFCAHRYLGSLAIMAKSCTEHNTEDENDEP
jgi:hypothetical protein